MPELEQTTVVNTSSKASELTTKTNTILAGISQKRPNLYAELIDFVSYLLTNQPKDAFQQLESIAASLQATQRSTAPQSDASSAPASAANLSHIVDNEASRLTLLNYFQNLLPSTMNKAPSSEEEEEEPLPLPDVPAFLPDLRAQFALLSEAGIQLREGEIVELDRSLSAFASYAEGIESIRFWGKIHALNGRDYYIIEVKKSDYSSEEERDREARDRVLNETGEDVGARQEVFGSGANEFLYYVCQDLTIASTSASNLTWTPLPPVSPLQIQAARQTRRLLTGDLQAPVGGFPRFPGQENHYLRTQIARITHSTHLAPEGAWKEEEGDVYLEDEEWRGVLTGSAVQWQHIRGHLRNEGRVEPFVDEEAEATEDAAASDKNAIEERVKLLRATTADTHSLLQKVWTYRSSLAIDTGFAPSPVPINSSSDDEVTPPAQSSHLVNSAASLLWPGAVNIAHGRVFAHAYVGWALKKDRNVLFRPKAPSNLQTEFIGDMSEAQEVLATAEELAKEAEEEAERKASLEENKATEEDDDLPEDSDDKAQEE